MEKDEILKQHTFYYPKSDKNPLTNFEQARYAKKPHGVIQSFGANTHQGIHRNYNEDRVSAITHITRPKNRPNEPWPMVSYFAIFDGHGGNECADFLKDKLHKIIVNQKTFPADPCQAMTSGCMEAE
jgi:hypothetical protein